jgi:hypothetical protein
MMARIRELAEQAGIDFFNSIDPEFSGREYCEAWTEQQQKFAELIVQECLYKIENEAAQYAEPAWAVELVNDIKEHFGVER